MKLFGREFKFNNNKVYHAGDKPTPSEIGAAASSHTHNYAGSSSAGGAANSANTLATARTINGTSFNGSANITTANWGTARTLTIGSTGKSVNGSGNVSWSLSEIGAAAASHTHSYLPLSGGTLTGRLTANGKVSAPTTGGSWINGMTLTNATIGITTQQTTSSYHPILAVKTSGNHVANIGGLGDNFGFYGFKSGRTENATDWSFVFNASSGAVTSTAAITAPTFNGALNGNATTATTATKANALATARTINGTSFNGSANITTANWGTARTLTIGNTGKSVNGSGNVSWTLSEIGAFSSGGGDLGGNIHLTKDNTGITGVCGGGTDRWGIIGGGADDNGYLEINTKDNGNEPIYVRQYDANGLVRTAALLDGNGATSFPSKISVPIFHILNSPGSQYNAIFGGSGDAADWNTHNVVFKSHWGIGFRDYQDVCRIVFDTRSGNINTRGLLYSEGGISCTAWGHFNGSISADGGATIGSHTYINAMSVGDKITGETRFSKDGAW